MRLHLARATFDAITHQIADVLEAMEQDVGHAITELRADGGGSANAFLMQLQADTLGKRVLRAELPEIGAIGVASMALDSKAIMSGLATAFDPHIDAAARIAGRNLWASALKKA